MQRASALHAHGASVCALNLHARQNYLHYAGASKKQAGLTWNLSTSPRWSKQACSCQHNQWEGKGDLCMRLIYSWLILKFSWPAPRHEVARVGGHSWLRREGHLMRVQDDLLPQDGLLRAALAEGPPAVQHLVHHHARRPHVHLRASAGQVMQRLSQRPLTGAAWAIIPMEAEACRCNASENRFTV